MWHILQEIDEKYKIGCEFTDSNLTMTHPTGGRLQLFGADMKNFIRRLKGVKTPGVAIDEAQDFGTHMTELVESVLEPTIADYSTGWLALTGTPGPVPHGYFYNVICNGYGNYSVHSWSILDNPFMPNAEAFIKDLMQKKGWDEFTPTLRREWRGEWVLDTDALVFKYDERKNDYLKLPDADGWHYVIGIDMGFDDADAIAVVGWCDFYPMVYLVDEKISVGQDITALARQVDELIKKYNPEKVVVDSGGLGKKIAETFRQRYALPIVAAEKARKSEYIEILNDAMRQKKFFAKKTSRFAHDAKFVKWDTSDWIEGKDESGKSRKIPTDDKFRVQAGFHSDICDAVLYAMRECWHYLSEREAPIIPQDHPLWLKKQEEDMLKQMYDNALEQGQLEQHDVWGKGGFDSF